MRDRRPSRWRRLQISLSLFIDDAVPFLFGVFILSGCIALGVLFSYGLGQMSSHGTGFMVLATMITSSVFLLLFAVLKWFGLYDLRGWMVVLGYASYTMEKVLHASTILHRPLWIGILLGVVCIVLGLRTAPYPETSEEVLSRPEDRIPLRTRILVGDRNIIQLMAEKRAREEVYIEHIARMMALKRVMEPIIAQLTAPKRPMDR